MDQKTKAIFDKLEWKLQALEQELSDLPVEQLSKSPKPGAWSVLDILHHLKLAEAYGHKYSEKKLSFNPSLPKDNWQAQFRSWLLNTFNRSSLKVKAPKGVDESFFPKEIPFEQIMEEWKAQRKALRTFLEGLDPEIYTKQVYKHPLGGRLSLADMLRFFDSHFDRHHRQIQRTYSSSKN
ncbi:MAG: hypothetical protein Sapg2KO_41850 [Saprospiraceae bacterium]